MEKLKLHLAQYWYYYLGGLVLAAIAYAIYKQNLAKKRAQAEIVVLQGANGTEYSFNPGPYTDDCHKALEDAPGWWGSWIYSTDHKPFQNLLAISDASFVAVANDWNSRYRSSSGNKTLRQKINDVDYGSSFLALKDQLLQRFTRMGIQ